MIEKVYTSEIINIVDIISDVVGDVRGNTILPVTKNLIMNMDTLWRL